MDTDENKQDFTSQSQSTDREILTIGLGTCGNRMSTGFWRNILDEHGLNLDGTLLPDSTLDYQPDNSRINTYFREMKDIPSKYVPRNLICDLDVSTIDSVRASNLGSLFNPDSYIYEGNSAQNIYSIGYSSPIIDEVLEEIRSETEKCSSLQGFTLLHALGGGTGSGLTSYLSQLLNDEYNDRIVSSYTVYPSNEASDIVIEPYNMILSMPSLLKYHTFNCCIDNETLFDISSRLFHNERPRFIELNEYICNIISSSTAGIRFKGSLNMDLRKLATNLIPFPRLKFLSISDAPLMYDHVRKYTKISIERLINELFHSHQFLSNIPQLKYGKYLAASIVFRGAQINKYDIKLNEWEIVHGLRKTMDELYTESLCLQKVNILHSTLVYQPSCSYPLTGTLFANNTAIKGLFERNLSRFHRFYKRKAHLQYYTNHGTVVEDFDEAVNECKDLIEDYNDKDESQKMEEVNQYQIDMSNRGKLQKNKVYWNQLKRQKKVQKKSKKAAPNTNKAKTKRKGNKRVVIMNHKRRKQLQMKKKNQKKRKTDESSDDFEEESASDEDSEKSGSGDSSASDEDNASSDTDSDNSSDNNGTSSYGLGDSDDNNKSSDSDSKSSSSDSSDSDNADSNDSDD